MTSNTKQSEDTYIQWSVNMNDAIQVGQLATEPILTIHPDGRVTTSDKLKPDEIASAVLQMMKEQWLMDPQAKLIREQNDRIKRLEEALRRIANQDYRGNRSTESQIAFDALKEAKP